MSIDKPVCGALFSKKDVRDYKIDCTTQKQFPSRFELKMPKVKDQGTINSCVACSIATVVEYYNTKQLNHNEDMSIGYIYGNRTNTDYKGEGMYTREAIASTCKYGDVSQESFPYNEEVPEIINKFSKQSKELFDKGYPNRFSSYVRLSTNNEIKTFLMQNGPVIFAMPWYDDIKVVNGVINTTQQGDAGGHCMVIYGWEERGWKIQNSWGTNWSNNGRAILPYGVKLREAWGVVDNIMASDTKIIKPYDSSIGSIIAKVLNVLANGMCTLLKTFK